MEASCLWLLDKVIRKQSLFLPNFVEKKLMFAAHGALYEAKNNGNYQM
jgi:hypothetical protein